jgi:probable F420-dependent oxidoreductase
MSSSTPASPASRPPLRLAVTFAGAGFADGSSLAQLPGLARQAEALGVDQLAVPDHVVLGPNLAGYPFGPFPETAGNPYPEPLTVLAAVASVTSRLELAPSVVIVPLRPAPLLAKTCATLDVLSNGRLVLGVGTGWYAGEFEASGVPFAGRGARMDDALRACRVLWAESPASFSSETVSFEEMHCEPRPLRRDSIRVWVGGSAGARTVARIAEYGDGWIAPPALPPDELAAGVERLRDSLAAAGRDPGSLDVKVSVPIRDGDVERSLAAAVPPLAAAGVTMIQVAVGSTAPSRAEAPAFLERLTTCFAAYRGARAS